MTLLAARGLARSFGGVEAVAGVDLDVAAKGVHSLIGPNGAGKTTLTGLICGRITPDAGTIRFAGQDITRLPAPARVRLGIAYTFQITAIYPGLSVFDNLALAVQRRVPARGLAEAVQAELERVGLASRAAVRAGALSYGHQRLLELGMGLALGPRLLILDEPTQGLAADEIAAVVPLIREVGAEISVLMIEHNIEVVNALAGRVSVLVEGRVLAVGSPAEIAADPAVRAAYLG